MRSPLHRVAVALGGLFGLYCAVASVLPHCPEPIGSRAHVFIDGARTTLILTLVAGILGTAIGILGGLARMSRRWLIRAFALSFVSIFQGTPLLIQILFVFYGLPALFPGLKLNELTASIVALALNVGAYNTETVRAGIMAIPKGQWEAAHCLGLTRVHTLRWIILPQAIRWIIPPLMNNIASLLKDSSLVSTIGLLELTLAGNHVMAETFLPIPSLFTVSSIYFVFTALAIGLSHWLQMGNQST